MKCNSWLVVRWQPRGRGIPTQQQFIMSSSLWKWNFIVREEQRYNNIPILQGHLHSSDTSLGPVILSTYTDTVGWYSNVAIGSITSCRLWQLYIQPIAIITLIPFIISSIIIITCCYWWSSIWIWQFEYQLCLRLPLLSTWLGLFHPKSAQHWIVHNLLLLIHTTIAIIIIACFWCWCWWMSLSI